jgi:hypothetical protein
VEQKGIEQNGNAKQERKTRSDKKYKILPALDSDSHHKLKRLALACDTNKTQLAAEIIRVVVNHTDFINWLQEKYKGPEEFRIIPVRNSNGRLEY